jgi:hypothetical protein
MTDDPDLRPPDADEQRAALYHIIGYRHLRRAIRSSGTGTLFWGGLLLVIWYLAFYQNNRALTVLGLIHLGLAAAEFATGLVKKLLPVPEAFLLEAAVFLAFAGANGYRAYEARQQKRPVPAMTVGFGLYMLYAAAQRVGSYRELSRARFRRPTGEQLRWFDDLLAEVKGADPEFDPHSLDLPVRPPLRAKLLGDTALVMGPADDDPTVLTRADLRIDREAPRAGEKLPTGHLSLFGEPTGSFPLDEYNWKNYAAWKAAGGDPPPPLQARPAGGE